MREEKGKEKRRKKTEKEEKKKRGVKGDWGGGGGVRRLSGACPPPPPSSNNNNNKKDADAQTCRQRNTTSVMYETKSSSFGLRLVSYLLALTLSPFALINPDKPTRLAEHSNQQSTNHDAAHW